MMNVILYQYNDRERIVNKYNTGNAITEVANINLTPYGRFDWNDITFTLKKMYKCNYATYVYNGIKYSGYVTVSVRADGLNEYHITNDPLTTCWENGCFKSANLCKYSSLGNQKIADSRVMMDPIPVRVDQRYDDSQKSVRECWYVISIIKRFPSYWGGDSLNGLQYETFAMSYTNYIVFLNNVYFNLDDTKRQQAIQDIISIYQVPQYELNVKKYFQTSSIKFAGNLPGGSADFNVGCGTAYMLHQVSGDPIQNGTTFVEISLNQVLYYDPYKYNTKFTLVIPNTGTISFTWQEIYGLMAGPSGSVFEHILSVGYRVRYDFISGLKKCVLTVNSFEIEEYSVISSIPMKVPLFIDTHIEDWKSWAAGAIGTAITTGVGIAATAASGGTLAPIAISSIVGSAANAAVSGITMANQDANAADSVMGGTGGALDYFMKPFVVFKYYKPLNHTAISGLFGFPDGQARYLNTIKGYVQTDGCKLFVNGLPKDLVQEAESLCNDGVYIV